MAKAQHKHKQHKNGTCTLPESEMVAYGKRLEKKFKGHRCMNCANAYDFSSFIIGSCKCRVYTVEHKSIYQKHYPWGLDKACEQWRKR